MSLAFLLMLTSMVIAMKKRRFRGWYPVHKWMNIGAAVGALAAMVIAYVMVASSHGYHLISRHAVLGAVTFLFIAVTPFLGLGIRSRKVKPAHKKMVRTLHRWFGRLTLALMAVTIVLGLRISGLI
jgi:hypothetical protein